MGEVHTSISRVASSVEEERKNEGGGLGYISSSCIRRGREGERERREGSEKMDPRYGKC